MNDELPIPLHVCHICQAPLTDENWYESYRRNRSYTCKSCSQERRRQWRAKPPEPLTLADRDYFSSSKAAFLLDMPVSTLLGWSREMGLDEATRPTGSWRRFSVKDINKLMEKRDKVKQWREKVRTEKNLPEQPKRISKNDEMNH